MGGERIIEMTWRCSACQTQNLGRHKSCQKCGNPKDASEQFEMPSETMLAPTVTDPNLLRMATAGPDWRCQFCGADQRRLDGVCQNCGAPFAETPPDQPQAAPPIQPPPIQPPPIESPPIESPPIEPPQFQPPQFQPAAALPPRKKPISAWTVVLFIFMINGSCVMGLLKMGNRPYSATVSAISWEHVIDVERYALRSHQGFEETIPADAIQVKRLGMRVHHTERVLDGYTTQSFVDTVPDGTRLESYRVREACGEDCTTTPEKCREVCTSNSNGFATCRQECSGGRRKCKTRYCTETRTREVPKTRREIRQKQVPAFREVPQYQFAFSYQAWSWAPDRTVRETGSDPLALRWPEGARTTGLPAGEKEREKRTAKYVVTLKYLTDETVRFEVKHPSELERFRVGSEHTLDRNLGGGQYTVDGVAVTALR